MARRAVDRTAVNADEDGLPPAGSQAGMVPTPFMERAGGSGRLRGSREGPSFALARTSSLNRTSSAGSANPFTTILVRAASGMSSRSLSGSSEKRHHSGGGAPRSGPLLTLAACIGWVLASGWIILVNKHIMSTLKFPYPVAVGLVGMTGTTIASTVYCKVLRGVANPQKVCAWHKIGYRQDRIGCDSIR